MVTSNVDAVDDGDVGNHARFASHDVVYLIYSVSIRASPCPSPSCFLLKLCVHDLEMMSLHLSEMSLAHILERSSVGICLLCVGLVLLLWNSQRILLLCCLSISC